MIRCYNPAVLASSTSPTLPAWRSDTYGREIAMSIMQVVEEYGIDNVSPDWIKDRPTNRGERRPPRSNLVVCGCSLNATNSPAIAGIPNPPSAYPRTLWWEKGQRLGRALASSLGFAPFGALHEFPMCLRPAGKSPPTDRLRPLSRHGRAPRRCQATPAHDQARSPRRSTSKSIPPTARRCPTPKPTCQPDSRRRHLPLRHANNIGLQTHLPSPARSSWAWMESKQAKSKSASKRLFFKRHLLDVSGPRRRTALCRRRRCSPRRETPPTRPRPRTPRQRSPRSRHQPNLQHHAPEAVSSLRRT